MQHVSNKILLAEDDRAARESLARALELEGYTVMAIDDGVQAVEAIRTFQPELLILDVMMLNADGLSVCRRLRSEHNRTPILIVTAKTEVSDRVAGLDAGADDYLTKPFALEELLARTRALLRRGASDGVLREILVGDLRIDQAARRTWRGEREIDLTKTEFELLVLLANHADVALSHTQIYEEIWGYDFGPESKSLAVYIGYLRRKTEEGGEARIIQTVRGVGYSLRFE